MREGMIIINLRKVDLLSHCRKHIDPRLGLFEISLTTTSFDLITHTPQ